MRHWNGLRRSRREVQMRTDNLNRYKEQISKNEDLAKVFYEAYRKRYIGPSWELATVEFKKAISDGVDAVVDELEKHGRR